MAGQFKQNLKSFFSAITTQEATIKNINTAALMFYAASCLSIVLGFFFSKPLILDGIIFIILAFLFKKFRSRIIAVILLMLSIGAVIVTVYNIVTRVGFGRNLLLTIIILWAGIRAVQATFVYHRLSGQRPDYKKIAKQILITGIILPLVSFLCLIGTFVISILFFKDIQTMFQSDNLAAITGVWVILFIVGIILLVAGLIMFIRQKR